MQSNSTRPRQADLRRAVSTAYYAVFHCAANCCADMLIGGPQARRNKAAWQQVYRSLDHGHARKKCQAIGSRGLAPKIRRFAAAFASLQAKRHLADYDPDETFYKSAVLTDIAIAEAAIHDLETAPLADKTAFAAWLLLKDRA